jgi:hypothetical protein
MRSKTFIAYTMLQWGRRCKNCGPIQAQWGRRPEAADGYQIKRISFAKAIFNGAAAFCCGLGLLLHGERI